jgi:hypothetical protein
LIGAFANLDELNMAFGPPSETGSDIDMIRLRRLCISVADAGTGRLALSRKVDRAKVVLFPDS